MPLESISLIKLANEKLDAELRKALAVLATAHATDKKSVELSFLGKGTRRVWIGYIRETPVWKTTYRLVLSTTRNLCCKAGRSSKTPPRRTGTTCN